MKLREVRDTSLKLVGYSFRCFGCGHDHVIDVPRWQFDGNMAKPTFSPSIKCTTGSYANPKYIDPEGLPPTICHFFIENGNIKYLTDCTHYLKGQTIELLEIYL